MVLFNRLNRGIILFIIKLISAQFFAIKQLMEDSVIDNYKRKITHV